ncbi:MAG: nuclear transport factor 2 family protein, partial [Chloroflexi bacterium]|nr:nuclear transport factor 2 family protein [Chloroflexota bacterium]
AAWAATLALDAASDAEDWDAFTAVLHPEYQAVDRRRTVSESGHAQTYGIMFGLDEWRRRHVLIATRGDRLVLVRSSVRFRDGASGHAEVETLTIFEVAPDGRIIRDIGFDVDDLEVATAELDARSEALAGLGARYEARHPPPRFANAAWRSVTGDAVELVATRGDLLALVRTRTGWLLVEVTADGNQVAIESFSGDDDVDAALDVLDERYSAANAVVRFANRWSQLVTDGEWVGLADLLTPDSVLDDRRPARFGVVRGRDAIVDLYRTLAEAADEIRVRNLHVREGSHGVWLTVGGMVGVANGAPFETPIVVITWLDDEGRTARRELYGLDQLDEALARFRAVTAAVADPFRNAVDDTGERFRRAWAERDWNAVTECFSPNFVWENRQALRPVGTELGASLDDARSLFDHWGSGAWETERLATRGD